MPDTETETIPISKLAYSVKEAALALGLSEITIYRLLNKGKLKSVPSLRHKLIPAKEITHFLSTAE